MIITPDEAALQAVGSNALDPKKRYDSAKQGLKKEWKWLKRLKIF